MSTRKFRPGLKYVFTTKKFKKDAERNCFSYHYNLSWIKKCNGKEVNVLGSFCGKVGDCEVQPDWCKVVK